MDLKHIIWDWNGTLLDDSWLCVESINKSLKKRNLPQIDKEKYFQVRPSHEIRYGWQMRETQMNSIPLLREVLILGTVYLLDMNSGQ